MNLYVHCLKICTSALRFAKGTISVNDHNSLVRKQTSKFAEFQMLPMPRGDFPEATEGQPNTRVRQASECAALGMGSGIWC